MTWIVKTFNEMYLDVGLSLQDLVKSSPLGLISAIPREKKERSTWKNKKRRKKREKEEKKGRKIEKLLLFDVQSGGFCYLLEVLR